MLTQIIRGISVFFMLFRALCTWSCLRRKLYMSAGVEVSAIHKIKQNIKRPDILRNVNNKKKKKLKVLIIPLSFCEVLSFSVL
jgi:hypothetical protein